MMKQCIVYLCVFCSITFLSGCMREDERKSSPPKVSEVSESQVPTKVFSMDSFTKIENGNYYPQFSLKTIKVQKGDLVRIQLNTLNGNHDFKIDEFDVYVDPQAGSTETIEFIADKVGEFEYRCTKPGHKKNGHWGTLIVE